MQDSIGFLNHLMIEKKLKSINPKNNIKLFSWKIPSLNDINVMIGKTAQAQMCWSGIDLVSRLNYVKKLALILNERAKDIEYSNC